MDIGEVGTQAPADAATTQSGLSEAADSFEVVCRAMCTGLLNRYLMIEAS